MTFISQAINKKEPNGMNTECPQVGEAQTLDQIMGANELGFGNGLAVALELASITILMKNNRSVQTDGKAAYSITRHGLLRARMGIR